MYQISSQRIIRQLIKEITTGIIPPGSRIIEADLAKRFGVSRGPLREALQKLEAKRLITTKPNIGATVINLSKRELIELYQIRESLEGLAAGLAAKNMKQDDIAAMHTLIGEFNDKQLTQDSQDMFSSFSNLDFHMRVIKGSGNEKLRQYLCEDIYYVIMLYRIKYLRPDRQYSAILKHTSIAEAIAERDSEMAEMLMRRHIRNSLDYITEHYDVPVLPTQSPST